MTIRTPYAPLGKPAAYEIGEVIIEMNQGSVDSHLESGFYQTSIIGAGGGAGGGGYKSGGKGTGGGGGSGAGLVGVVFFPGGNYHFEVGAGGNGGGPNGKTGYPGVKGGDTIVSRDGQNMVLAGGGNGGVGHGQWSTNPAVLPASQGGVLTISDAIRIQEYSVKSNGNNGGGANNGASGKAVDGLHGAGGYGSYKAAGTAGNNGFIKLSYLGLSI